MAIKMSDVATEYKRARSSGHPYTIQVLRGILIRSLTDQQFRVLQALPISGYTTSREVAKLMKIKQNHAINLLTRLQDLHLAKSKPIVDKTGLHYRWICLHEAFELPPGDE